MNDGTPRHPEATTMAAFAEGTLPAAEVAAVTSHLRDCGDCRTVLSETARFERDETTRRRRSLGWWTAAAAAVGTIAISIPFVQRMEWRRSPLASLIAAAPREHRHIEARLSGFPWARLQAAARGASAPPDPADLKLAGAAGSVLENEAVSPESRHAHGVAYLMIKRRLESLAALERAAEGSTDARIWNDLAAARYASAVEDERASLLPLALAAADRAIAIDSKSAEPHFNRALILERMGLRDAARKAWQEYLALDRDSDWAAEARERLRRLEERTERFDLRMLQREDVADVVRRFPQDSRASGELLLLSGWADARIAGDDGRASAQLAAARRVGAALAAASSERLLTDAVAAIDAAHGDVLVHAHRAYHDARAEYHARNVSAAEPKFRRAAELFRAGASPMAHVAEYYAASAAFDQNRPAEAREALLALRGRIDRERHRALDAQIGWQLAVVANTVADWGEAAREAEAAVAIFRSLGERANAATNELFAAHALDRIGEHDLAWSRRTRALAELEGDAAAFRRSSVLQPAAATLSSLGESDAAAALLDVTLAEIRDGNPAALTVALTQRVRLASVLRDDGSTQRTLNEAQTALARTRDASLREYATANVQLAQAVVDSASRPRHALPAFDRAMAFYAPTMRRETVAEVHLQRARARCAVGDQDGALADYTAALRQLEKDPDPEAARAVAGETIELLLARGDVAAAFAVIEPERPVVPPGVAVIRYAVLPEVTIAFSLQGTRLAAERLAIGRNALAERIDALALKIRRCAPIDQVRADAAALHAILIAPLRAHLAGARELVIIPDRELHALPFAALYHQHYLAEEFIVRLAPSAVCSETQDAAPLSPATVIADPAAPQQPRLSATLDEANEIASMYGATLITGSDATRARFLDAVQNSALLHYAGHADSDAAASYGALLLTPSNGDRGLLGAGEIARLRLPRRPLVVLAACGTFRGTTSRSAGMTSLGRAFLTAGARAVVGTLWEVDDDVAATLFLRFHQHLRAGASPAHALRDAQVDMLNAADPHLQHPATWSAVVVHGRV